MSAPAWIAVGLLGGAAAAARYLIDTAVAARADHPFPHGILAVNIIGALASVWSPASHCFAAVALGHWLGGVL